MVSSSYRRSDARMREVENSDGETGVYVMLVHT